MKSEDLFRAIGAVEESRLARSELTVPSGETRKEKNMKKTHISAGRILRNLLVAALILSLVGITAYAAVGYLIFDSPNDMVAYLFGDETGFDHKDATTWTDPEKPGSVYENPGYDRIPVDEGLAASEAAPLVSPVGQSISWKGYTLTVDANLYDEVTKCGILTYTLENPAGIKPYEVQPNGEFYFPDGDIVDCSQYGKSFLIQDKTTSTKLTAAYYYQLRDPQTRDLVLTFYQWAAVSPTEVDSLLAQFTQEAKAEIPLDQAIADMKQQLGDGYDEYVKDMTPDQLEQAAYFEPAYRKFEAEYTCPDSITIPEQSLGEMRHVTLGGGAATVSPIAMYIDTTQIGNYPNDFVAVAKLRFTDGTEYVVCGDDTANYAFAVSGSTQDDVTYLFNRMVDVTKIASLTLDSGIELTVDKPN